MSADRSGFEKPTEPDPPSQEGFGSATEAKTDVVHGTKPRQSFEVTALDGLTGDASAITPKPEHNGKLLRLTSNDPRVYWVDHGYGRIVPHPDTFNNLFWVWENVEVYEQRDIPLVGPNIPTDAVLVRGWGENNVYLVDRPTHVYVVRWVNSLAAFEKYRFSWNNLREVPPAVIRAISAGEALTVESGRQSQENFDSTAEAKKDVVHGIKPRESFEATILDAHTGGALEPRNGLNGKLYRQKADDPQIWWIDQGYRRLVPDPDTFNNLFWVWENVEVYEDLFEIPTHTIFPTIMPGAVLVRAYGSTDFPCFVDGGSARRISSEAVLKKYQFFTRHVRQVPPIVILAMRNGPALV